MATAQMTCPQRPSVRPPSERVGITAGKLITPFATCTDLRKHFQEIARKHSPEPRSIHTFLTTAIVRSVPSLSVSVSECGYWAGHTRYG